MKSQSHSRLVYILLDLVVGKAYHFSQGCPGRSTDRLPSAFFAAPISETVGRNPVYIATMTLFMIFIMASGLVSYTPTTSQVHILVLAQTNRRTGSKHWRPAGIPLSCGHIRCYAVGLCRRQYFRHVDSFRKDGCLSRVRKHRILGPILGPVLGGFIRQAASKGIISWH